MILPRYSAERVRVCEEAMSFGQAKCLVLQAAARLNDVRAAADLRPGQRFRSPENDVVTHQPRRCGEDCN